MLEIKTGVLVGVEIDGIEYKLEEGGFKSLTMCSNKRMAVVTAELVISDMSGKLDTKFTMADGVPLTIKIGRSVNDYDTYKFRVYSFKRDPMNTTPQYTIMAIANAPKWFYQAWKPPIEDTSSNVIAKLAAACGLASDVDATNDNQIWLSSNSRTCEFAREIARRGYLDDKSAMALGMAMDGTIRYKNLTTIKRNGPKFVHGDNTSDAVYRVYDQKYLNGSGFGNSSGGYKHSIKPQSVLKATATRTGLEIKRLTQHLLLNKTVRDEIDGSRIDIGHVDCGNVHEHWENARYQNLRTSMMYSLGVHLLIQQQTPLTFDLFSSFSYQAMDPPASGGQPKENSQYSADFVVTAKTIMIGQGDYFEKIEGFTTGINNDPDRRGSQY